jgi:hypothetical protein
MNMTHARASAAGTLATGLCIIVVAAGLPSPVTAAPPDDQFDVADLRARVGHLRERVAELAGHDDLLDTLHFGWFDRPCARATLAILVKTTSALEREIRLRELGNGTIPDATVRTMLSWAEEAPKRVVAAEPVSGFRPHRLRAMGADFDPASAPAPLFAFVDRATATRHHDVFGDLDLMAALGMRVYPRMADDLHDPDAVDLIAARVSALAMATVFVGEGAGDSLEEAPDPSGAALRIRRVSLRELLQGIPNTPGVVCGLRDPAYGESWPASLARKAVGRGILGERFIAADWNPPNAGGSSAGRAAATATMMWVCAIEGQSLTLLPGWRDLRDGSASPFPSILLDPARVEIIARTALDLIRLSESVQPFKSTPPLAVVVGADAVHTRDDNTWASWTKPVWNGLLDRQIRFDVVSADRDERQLGSRYPVVFPLRRDEVGDPKSTLLRIERALALQSGQVHRVTVRELDGRLATDVFVRDARIPGGKPCVVLANLSGRSRRVKLRGGPRLGAVNDRVVDQRIAQPGESIPLAPWQVRLLWPSN